jgi:hypothetical protein
MFNDAYINNLIQQACEDGTTADLGAVPSKPLGVVASNPEDVLLIVGDLMKHSKGVKML